MINNTRKSHLVLLFLVLSNTSSLETNKSLDLLSTHRILSFHEPFYDVSQNHIATFQAFENQNNSILFSFNTYTLDGKTLQTCDVHKPHNLASFSSYTGSLTSLGDNQTEVLMWTTDGPSYYSYGVLLQGFDLHLRVIKPATYSSCNKFIDDRFRISKTGFTNEYYGFRHVYADTSYVAPYVVPYVDSFDIIFPLGGYIVKARYSADGIILKNPINIMAADKPLKIVSVNSVKKYDESSNLLIIMYEFQMYQRSNLTAVLANQKGEVLKRKALINLTYDEIQKRSSIYNNKSIFGEVDHGKLVLCDFRTNVTRCERYNATSLESEVSVEIKTSQKWPFGRINLLPDGGFLLLQFDTREEDTVYTLTRVNADGSIWKTIEISTCSVLPMSTYPYIYPKDDGVCLAYMCVGVVPFNMPNRNIRPYSTHISCYE